MSEWKKVKIGDFLKRKRIPIQLEADKEYKLITIKLYHKGVFLRGNKKGSEIHSNMYKVSKGDFILSGIDARNGAFGIVPDSLDGAIVTNDFWYFDIDESIIKKEFFLWLTSTPVFLDACQKASMGETQRIRLQKDAFFNYQIKCPSIEYQDEFLARIKPIIEKIKIIQSETEKQTEYAKLLRQNILQQAIEGKLTADWRKQNPVQKGNPDYDAEALFEQIQKERNNEKKQKELSPITDEGKPFEIPEGWKWVRLGEISDSCLGKMLDSAKNQGVKRKYLRNLNVRWFSFDLSDVLEMKIRDDELNRCSARKSDLLICEGGYPGRSAIWDEDYDICFQKAIHRVRFYGLPDMPRLFNLFLFLLSESGEIETYLTGEGIKHLTGIKLKQIKLPLPPLKEQEEIVNKVETLLAKLTTLENQIQDRKSLSDKLIFGIIKENLKG